MGGCTAEPSGLACFLAADPARLRGARFTGVPIPGVNRIDWSALATDATMETLFVTPELRAGFEAGRVRFLPQHYSRAAMRLATPGHVAAAVIRVAEPREGAVSLGPTADFAPHVIAGGARLFAQIDPALPSPPGAPRVALDRFEAVVEDGAPLPELAPTAASGPMARIGERIAALVPERATLQLGLGKVQAAVLAALEGRRGLRFHGGMISDATMDRIEDGTFSRGVTTGVAIGTRALYDWAAGRADVAYREVGHTHRAAVLSGLERLVSVNAVLSVDLFGQAVADMIDARQVSGHGGLVDFARGAAMSEGGLSILACASTAGRDGPSRIVARPRGGAATVMRGDADWVVTEHGAAHIADLDVDARAEALVAIAAPEHRDALARDWAAMRAAM